MSDGSGDAGSRVADFIDAHRDEIVQLYVGFDGSTVERPVKLLRAFTKAALEPGETKTVPLSVSVRDLAWYDVVTSSWTIEPMTYRLLVGPSSRQADLLTASVTVADGAAPTEFAPLART